MSFDVYPQPPTAPLNVTPGGPGHPTLLTNERHSGGGSPEMFIRVAIIGSAVAPTLKLQAGAGDPVVPLSFPMTAPVFDGPGGTGNHVADITVTTEPNGVYLVNVFLSKLDSAWTLTIVNNDAVARGFTFVVADSGADSQQPWIDMETTTAFNALITETGNQTLRIFNHGTGPMTGITAAVSGAGAAGFTVTVPAGLPVNPNSSVDVPVTLNAAATPQSFTATLDIGSNDTTAQKVAGHNSEVALSATVRMLELGFMLDASGSMALDPDGQSTFIGVDNGSTRWGKLVSAADAALTMLKNFANGKGTFAVGMYPDITAFPADPTAPYGGPFPVPSPSANDFETVTQIDPANIADAIGSINKHFPRVNGAATPMGAGIAHAIGSTSAAPWGYFTTTNFTLNRRWLILMTDGNDNSDPPFPSDFFNNGTAGQGFVPKQVQVMALGYGNDQASGAVQPVNKPLLTNTVSAAYEGAASNYDFAQADATPDITTKFVKALLFAGLTLDSITDPTGVLTASNPTVTRQVIVGPYDNKISFIVAWSTANAERLDITVTTPLGEAIPPSPATGCTIDIADRYRMITLDKSYLDNARAGKPRYGTWTLTITLPSEIILQSRRAAVAEDSEFYSYQIVTDSRLNLRCTLDKTPYAAGDSITLSARLSLDGQGIVGAAVKVIQTTPGVGALNWLAAIPVSASDYTAAAAEQSRNPDTNSLGIKRLALQKNGTTFNPVTNSSTASLIDASGIGTYTVTSGNTSVPGTYKFLVAAVGTLPDGSLFHREQSVTIEVIVRADPASTIVQVAYLPGAGGTIQATFTVWPKDRFGNVILIDPKFDPTVQFTTSVGSFSGPIVDNHDGSYSQGLSYPAATPPSVGVTVGGVVVVPGVPLEPIGDLHFVDKVYAFKAGAEATPGANQHTDPTACVGDFTKKATSGFVSLGAGGSLIVGFSGHYARDDEHGHGITVFVHPDQPLRPYNVEAHYGDDDDGWFEIGQSPGVTQTFSLYRHDRLPTARAVRIRDLSGRTRNPDGTPSASPGVSILAVGARCIERGDGDLDDLVLAWLGKLGHELFIP